MKLRTQLVLAFFLLAVLPLAGVSIYSYNSSIRAFRQVVEAESGYLADDMSQRMESVSSDLNHRIQRLGGFPFRQLMAEGTKPGDPQRQALVSQLMAQIGESAPFIRALEFTPMGAANGIIAPSAQHPPRPVIPTPPPKAGEQPPDALIIRVTGDLPSAGAGQAADGTARDGRQMVMSLDMPPSAAPPAAPQPQPWRDRRRAAADAVLKELVQKTEALKKAGNLAGPIGEITARALEAGRREAELALGRNYASEVHREGTLVGRVRAQVSSGQILRHVLTRTQRKQGEIPFAFDSEGKMHTADPGDQPRLESLPVPSSFSRKDAPPQQQATAGNWIIVTRKDAGSGMTFGIARPIGQRLDEIRRTAVRNLGYGLGMVCLAFIGILPLSGRMTRNLTTLTHGAEQLARGDLQTRVDIKSGDEIGKLAQAFNRMAQDLSENQKHLVEQERMRKELEMCRKIQEELLPRKPLRSGLVEVQGVSIPAREVGGDFFNYFPMPDGRVALLIGDVSGKGLPAALLMANLQATIRARLPLEPDLAKLAGELDWEIQSGTPQEVYLTLFISILDTKQRILNYVNAGHNSQFVLHADGSVERLESTGRPLGLLPGAGYASREVQLKDGDSLFFYTDGLVETENAREEEFGMERLERLLLQERERGFESILANVEKVACEFRGDVEAADDATMVLVRIGKTEGFHAQI
jgi:serine phosphatase RsbU (regulator of sigma subunit)